jgi:hypothetical protein
LTSPVDTASPAVPGTAAIRAGIALLATFAFGLSYDALRQMAVAIHVRGLLTYAFPLVIDGFIAIGVGALLILRTAPLRSRVYVWALVGAATGTSIWANALHAVRLNQQTRQAGLHLDNVTVGVLSAVAPLALASAVHLYLVIRRHSMPRANGPGATEGHNRADASPLHAEALTTIGLLSPWTDPARATSSADEHSREAVEDMRSRDGAREHPSSEQETIHPVPERASATPQRTGRPPDATHEELLTIGRIVVARTGDVSRKAIVEEIRVNRGLKASNARLKKVVDALEAEFENGPALGKNSS